MKRTTILLFTIFTLVLTACGSASSRTNRSSASPNGSTTAELPATTNLLIGTLKLDGTAQAVTAKQAADLLPLWLTMKVLLASDTAAQQEKDALVAQIQETMTAPQMQAITDMKLTRADMFTLLQGQGGTGTGNSFTNGQNSNSQTRSSSSNGTRRNSGQGGGGFFPGAGGPPEGGFGGGGGFSGQGQNLSPSQIATAQASRQQRSGSLIPTALLNTLIEYLQKKAGA